MAQHHLQEHKLHELQQAFTSFAEMQSLLHLFCPSFGMLYDALGHPQVELERWKRDQTAGHCPYCLVVDAKQFARKGYCTLENRRQLPGTSPRAIAQGAAGQNPSRS